MNRFKRNMLIGMAVLGLGSAAFAAPDAPAPGSGPHGRHENVQKLDSAKFKERVEKRQAELHDKLKLTANQEAAWKTFTASMTSPAHNGKRLDRAEWERLSAPERMEKRLEMSRQRQEVLASRLAVVKAFYAQLTPEQQKVFNDNFAKPPRHFGHRRMPS